MEQSIYQAHAKFLRQHNQANNKAFELSSFVAITQKSLQVKSKLRSKEARNGMKVLTLHPQQNFAPELINSS